MEQFTFRSKDPARTKFSVPVKISNYHHGILLNVSILANMSVNEVLQNFLEYAFQFWDKTVAPMESNEYETIWDRNKKEKVENG